MKVRNVIGAVMVTCAILALPNCGKKEVKEKTEQVEQENAGLWGLNKKNNKKRVYKRKKAKRSQASWLERTQRKWNRWWKRGERRKSVDACFRETSQDYYNRLNGTCPYCSKKFKRPHGLRRHVAHKHPVELKKDEKK
jgi:hypothetical protein